ncbi:hypothetical protein OPIT5_01225 [Opitutaceae bacterium TAV5]|nr:hypothetical protein OPIT5_01225 [Opitutaceae bacterium TAV5]
MLTIDSDIYDITTNVNFTGSGELIKKGSGTLRLTGQDSSFRNADIAEGTLEVANASILFSESDDLTKHGAGTLRLTGVNNFANTYIEQGTLEIANGGVLSTGKINISGSPATLRFDNGTLRATQNGTYNDFISGGGSGSAVEIAAGGMTIDTRSFDVGTSSGVRFTGSGNLTKTGTGTFTISSDGSDNQVGGIFINEGTLAFSSASLGTTGITISDGASIRFSGDTTLRAKSDSASFLSGTTPGTAVTTLDSTLTVDTGVYNVTANARFTGTGDLRKQGTGILRLTGKSDATGYTNIERGTLEVADGGILSTSRVYMSSYSSENPATLRFDNGTLRATQSDSMNSFISGSGSYNVVEIAAGGMTIDTRSFEVGSSARFTGSGNLTKTGSGTFTISDGSDNQVGSIFVNEGTLAFSSANLGTTGITISDGANVRFSGDTTLRAKSDSASFLSGTTPGTAVATLVSTLTVDTGVYNVTANARFTGTGDLRKQGTGILRLTGKSDATGYTNIERGTLEVADGGVLSARQVYMSSYSSENPATLRFDNGTLRATQNDSMNSFISGGGSYNVVEIAAGGMTIDTRAFSVGSSARFTGSGNLTKTGSGTFTISDGSDNQVGGIFVNEGTLAFSSANLGTTGITISDGANVRFSGDTTLRAKSDSASFLSGTTPGTAVATLVSTLTVDTGVYNVTANARFTGTGDLRKQGTGILRLTGKSDATGYTNIERGTLEVADGGILSTSRVYMSGNYGYENPATLRFDNGTLRATQNDSMNSFISGSGSYNVVEIAAGGMTIDTRSFEVGSSARFTGTGNLTKTGSGTFTISGQSYYTGATIIRQGTLVVGNINALSASKTYFIGTGATLDLSALGTAYDLSGSGMAFDVGMTGTGLLDTGSNELILGGDLLFNFQEGSLDPRIVVKTLKSASVLTGATTTDTLTTPLWTSTVFNSGEQTGAFDSVILTGIISGTLTQTDNGLWTGIFDGYHFSFDGYNLSVNVSSVPEPATWGVIISLCCLGVTIWRRRK